jgi:DNA-binding CsgD family transcriptional regulator/tetratricopeptide (TPR) repeat protein
VANAADQLAAGRLGAGWHELGAGRWRAARDAFTAAATGGAPAAYEGLSWAAWWLDDGPAVFDARERAYRLYRAHDDAAGAARMAIWLACDQLDFRGAQAVAQGWLARARRLLEPLDRNAEHGWLAFFEGYLAHGAGDAGAAARLARDAAAIGRLRSVADLEMLGLALEGAVLVAGADVTGGMRCLDEATAIAVAGEARIPISCAWACCFMVTSSTAARDYERACAWCDRIAEFADRYGSRYMLAFCRAEYAAIELWRGRWDRAESLLTAAIEDFGRSRPAYVGGPVAQLAELRRRQGRTEEATRVLGDAPPSSSAQLCLGRVALDQGDATAARDLAARVLRRLPAGAALARAPALELQVRACLATGDRGAAARALAPLTAVAARVGTGPLVAAADLAEGMVAAARGDHAGARVPLEDAVDGFRRSGGPYEAAQARIELAATLRALGRAGAAEREARAAAGALRALGASAPPAGDAVTPRERDVLRLLAEGQTNQQIARRLVVSEHTVHRHVTNILRKLGVPTRAAAAVRAARTGLLD